MKCIYHKQDSTYRVMLRGRHWYVQHTGGHKGTRENDPWYNIGLPKDSTEEAIAAMHSYKPLVKGDANV